MPTTSKSCQHATHCSCALASNAAAKLDISHSDGNAHCVDCTQFAVDKQVWNVRFCRYLQRTNSRHLKIGGRRSSRLLLSGQDVERVAC